MRQCPDLFQQLKVSGTTALAVLLTSDGKLYVVNATRYQAGLLLTMFCRPMLVIQGL
jgi:hypothetical protein